MPFFFFFQEIPKLAFRYWEHTTILGHEMPAAETAASTPRVHPSTSSQGCSREPSDAAPQRPRPTRVHAAADSN